MKASIVVLLLAVYQLNAENVYAQTVSLSFSANNTTINRVIDTIEEQTEFSFLILDKSIQLNKEVSLTVNKAPINQVLDKLLTGTNIRYRIIDRQIVLMPAAMDEAAVQQQPDHVSGMITDINGEPIIGANVRVKGTEEGVITDINGKFLINASVGSTLEISYIGYITQEVRVANRNAMTIQLVEDNQLLSEVVVIGYGTQKKVTVTGSISSTSGAQLASVPTPSVANSLAGRLPGLISLQTNGEPGYDDAQLFIRGRSTTGDNSTLVVVDGVADRAGGFSRIDPNDIESVTILKDASAAIYGSRAANGVILVTTKRGASGKTSISYSGNVGFSSPTVLPKMASSWQYAELRNEIEHSIYGRADLYSAEQIQKFKDGSDPVNYPDIDAFDYLIRNNAPQTQHNLSMTGGNDKIRYFLSLGYQYQENYYKNSASNYAQYNLRSNIDINPFKNFKASVNVALRREDRNSPHYSSDGVGIWRFLVKYDPTWNIVWPGTDLPTTPTQEDFNPKTAVDHTMGYQRRETSYANLDLTAHYDMSYITPGLSADAGFYVDRSDVFYKSFTKQFQLYAKEGDEYVAKDYGPKNASLSENMNQNWGFTFNARLNYERTFAQVHNVKAFVAYEQYTSRYDNMDAYREAYIATTIDQLFAGDQTTATNNGSASETARLNYFGRVDYDYAGKYIAQFNWRYDGSQNFPKGKRFGFFPGVSLGWRISEEGFWKENAEWMDYLKLRASWGQMGNDRVAAFQYMTTYGFNNPAILGGADPSTQIGLWKSRTSNPNITWEVSNSFNIGLEANFLKDFRADLDLFMTKRSKILASRSASVPNYSGLSLPSENIGRTTNKGFEFVLGWNKKVHDFNIRLDGNVSYARSNIDFIDEAAGVVEWQKRTNMPINAGWVMYESIGIFRTQEELDAYPHLENAKVGDLIFRNTDGNEVLDGNDRVRLDKTGTPEIMYGLNFGVDWKNWTLNGLFQGAARLWQYTFFESGTIGNFTENFYLNHWTENNPNAPYPRVYDRQVTVVGTENTFWLQKADYLRLKNIELSYTFSKRTLTKLPFSSLRLYVSGFNLLTFTGMKNLDPETPAGNQNFAAWSTPQSRVYNVGVNITF